MAHFRVTFTSCNSIWAAFSCTFWHKTWLHIWIHVCELVTDWFSCSRIYPREFWPTSTASPRRPLARGGSAVSTLPRSYTTSKGPITNKRADILFLVTHSAVTYWFGTVKAPRTKRNTFFFILKDIDNKLVMLRERGGVYLSTPVCV